MKSFSFKARHLFGMSKTTRMTVSGAVAALMLSVVSSSYATDRLFVYPNDKQSDKRMAADRYECHRWAVAQTGFNPLSSYSPKPNPPVTIPVADNPARGAALKGTIAGAVVGAIIGAIDDDHVGEGAAIGAVVGSIAGGVAEDKGYQKVKAEARNAAYREADIRAAAQQRLEYDRGNYRRAIASCLESKDYTVK